MFTKLCGYIWIIDKDATILIYDNKNELYISKGIIFSALNHLEDIGLLSFASIGRYLRTEYSKVITAHYYGKLSCPFGKGV